MAKISNPFAFSKGPTTIIVTLIYVVVIVSVLVTQAHVPRSPQSPTPIHGINLTEAWSDLQLLSAQYHPYNSKINEFTQSWLLERVRTILKQNNASPTSAFIFNDVTSNLTYTSQPFSTTGRGTSVYFEGTNIIVYIPGVNDDEEQWWNEPHGKPSRRNGVLVNAHYDSVASGYGATDDGVGVVSILQLIRFYTTPGNKPANGLVLLLNNGEEDYLNGANVFSQHPMSLFPSSFLNLEGAGAGGKAALFRSTDEEVTRAYAKSPYPFGTAVSGDAFERGLVRSQTDYVVFNGVLGLRGLDVAFIEPRARYHTNQDDSRHTGKDSMWHMLSAAIATTQELTRTSLGTYEESGHAAVWFDIFGVSFAVLRAHTVFALSVTVLVVGPLLLLAILFMLHRADKLYLFTAKYTIVTDDGPESTPIGGWKGFFRFPPILVLSGAAPVALAFLLFKENPFVAHNSEWTVWAMMFAAFLFVAWFLARALDAVRPSALTRLYGYGWLCGAWWALLVGATVLEEQFHLVGGYFALIASGSFFLATSLAMLELFFLPKKHQHCCAQLGLEDEGEEVRETPRSRSRRSRGPSTYEDGEDHVTERTALLPERNRSAYQRHGSGTDSNEPVREVGANDEQSSSSREQDWSLSMSSWLWLVEFILVAPINIVILGQIGCFDVTALHQTGADGSSMFVVYLGVAILTILILSPAVPLLHRFTWHIPILLLWILIGTLIYNLLAFPFSAQNRMKVFFQQQVDLETQTNNVVMSGVQGYLEDAISMLPSAAGQKFDCVAVEYYGDRKCSWSGTPPNVLNVQNQASLEGSYKNWVHYNISRIENGNGVNTARFAISGRNTRACKLVLDRAVSDFHVQGQAAVDPRFRAVPEGGSTEIRLWSRTWERTWVVDLTWPRSGTNDTGLSGKIVCLWSDANQRGTIPAFDEALHFLPTWVALSKLSDGLVEGFKRFSI